jgi:poly(A) polymerase
MKLEFVETVVVAHPFVKGFEDVCHCLSAEELRTVSEGTISDEIRSRKKEDVEGKEGAVTVYSTNFFIGLAIEPIKPGQLPVDRACTVTNSSSGTASGPRKLDISYPTSEFTKMVKMWDHYEDEKMSVVVRIIKRSAILCHFANFQ